MADDDIKDPEELGTDEAEAGETGEAGAGRGGAVPGALGMDDPLGKGFGQLLIQVTATSTVRILRVQNGTER